ncbi:LytTR family DNA-binding domain-containing protein [Marivita hallyeonensis]|uniref:Transcriptional regulator, LytTR family n=1 Tax=Marivita hallyeonensis TaxID=996342 RepID=A0A1M5PGC9_9RHOB|nr:LytTR family DNA-binding domain-containing protein [Marivita hallyeonensis]SHH00323.1 transcriptional regulator, LytTR family [Marivita hallyeonensis]
MNNDPSHSTLREWRQHVFHPLTLTALASVAAILALVGPFGTQDLLSLPERAAYWTTLTGVGYVTGYAFGSRLLKGQAPPARRASRVILAGCLTGCAMTLFIAGLNWLVFRIVPSTATWPAFALTTIAISVIIMAVLDQFDQHLQPVAVRAADLDPPRLLDRLPLDKRGAIVALSVEDHYVRVRTTNGEDMLLMRLSDAIRETEPLRGAQVHRSHWVSYDQVTSVTRQGDRAILSMSHGPDIPVSRANLPKLKEAGLLP